MADANDYQHDTAFDEPLDTIQSYGDSTADDDLFLDPSFDQYCQPTSAVSQLNTTVNNDTRLQTHRPSPSSSAVIDLTSPSRITPYRNRLSLHTHSQHTNHTLSPDSADKKQTNLLAELNQSTDYDNTCCICLEPIADECCLNSCRHKFCLKCIVEWSHVTNSCPACRAEFNEIRYTQYDTPNKVHGTVKFIKVDVRKQADTDADEPEYTCEVCAGTDNADVTVLCDYVLNSRTGEVCNKAYHIYCLQPRLHLVPDDEWYCPEHQRSIRQQQRQPARRSQQVRNAAQAESNAARGVTRVQPERRQRSRHNHDHSDDDAKSVGYDSDDGFVVADDVVIYDSQRSDDTTNNRRRRRAGFPNSPEEDDDFFAALPSDWSEGSNGNDADIVDARNIARQRSQQHRRTHTTSSRRNGRERAAQRSGSDVSASIRQNAERIKRSDTAHTSSAASSSSGRRARNRISHSTAQEASILNAVINGINRNGHDRMNNTSSSSSSSSTSAQIRPLLSQPYRNSTFPVLPPVSRAPPLPRQAVSNVLQSLDMPANNAPTIASTQNIRTDLQRHQHQHQQQHKRLRKAGQLNGGVESPYFTDRR